MKMKTSLFHCMHCEIRVSALLIPLYVGVLALIFTVMLSMLSYALHIPEQMTDHLEKETSGIPYIAEVSSVYSGNAYILSDLSYADAEIAYLSEEQLLTDIQLRHNGKQLMAENGRIAVCIKEQHQTLSVTEGRSMRLADNTDVSDIIWISDTAAQNLQVHAGEAITLKGAYAGQVTLQIAGIFAAQTEDDPLFYLNAATAEQLMTHNSLSKRQTCRITFSNYAECQKGMRQLETLGCEAKCAWFEEADILYGNIRSIQLTFWLVSVILLLCVAIVLYAMNSMIVDYRQRFFALLRCLGASVRSILLLYGSISICLITVSILLSSLCSRLYIQNTVRLLNNYFNMELAVQQLYPALSELLLGWSGAILVCLPVFILLYRKLSRYNAVTLLRQSEREG
ncbi:MAG: hypothetical protein IKM30_05115 [Oscillospiraceae bacterium]|nr:hypothetical protein [Oscillospiraceae bacterium]